MSTLTLTRLTALGRSELTLLVRNRMTLFTALALPLPMVGLMRSVLSDVDLAELSLNATQVALTGGLVMALIFVIYANLIPVYVARREELVLKRLRTGETTDPEILIGAAVPSVLLGLGQCLVLIVTGAVLLDLRPPQRPDLLIAGLLLGSLTLAALAAATAAFTRTVESAQITGLPLMLVSFVGSGIFAPLEAMPDMVAQVLRLLPVTAVVDLVRTGWLGGATGLESLRSLGLALAWTAMALYAVQRWFRWEPRK